MNDKKIAIKVNEISKLYRIGQKIDKNKSFIGSILNSFKKVIYNFKNIRSLSAFKDKNEMGNIIWALKEVSFTIYEGERIGIIGPNGAGKSTLLKILSRITTPTFGEFDVQGRVSSLLEVGTGFHPDLTGRENIYLNGTILGMKKSEIDLVFDEIVSFAEVEKFLDTQVKRYSSGMRLRLAFSVAAHLIADVMIIDEVLAVGDVAFQKKCMAKMSAIGKQGKTILFVSHRLNTIKSLCPKSILIIDGKIQAMGDTNKVINDYNNFMYKKDNILDSEIDIKKMITRGNNHLEIIDLFTKENNRKVSTHFIIKNNQSISFYFKIKINKKVDEAFIRMDLKSDNTGENIFSTNRHKINLNDFYNTEFICELTLNNISLNPGFYPIYIKLSGQAEKENYHIIDDPLLRLLIEENEFHDKHKHESFGYQCLDSSFAIIN